MFFFCSQFRLTSGATYCRFYESLTTRSFPLFHIVNMSRKAGRAVAAAQPAGRRAPPASVHRRRSTVSTVDLRSIQGHAASISRRGAGLAPPCQRWIYGRFRTRPRRSHAERAGVGPPCQRWIYGRFGQLQRRPPPERRTKILPAVSRGTMTGTEPSWSRLRTRLDRASQRRKRELQSIELFVRPRPLPGHH